VQKSNKKQENRKENAEIVEKQKVYLTVNPSANVGGIRSENCG